MIEQLGSARSFEILQTATVYDPELDGGVGEFDEVLYYRHPDRFRSDVSTPSGEQIRVVSPEGVIFVLDGRIISETQTPFDHFKDVLLCRKKSIVLKHLSELHVDLNTVSLGKFKDKVAYVIGAKYPDDSVPQLWIEKDTFRPVRYVVGAPRYNNGVLEEIEYADYTPLDEKRSYPGRILFFRNGELVKMCVLKTSKVNPNLTDELFDVHHLRTLYEPITSTESPTPPPSDLDELKKTIRDFSKAYE